MDPARADRLKAALRENLKRRRAQARAREGGDGEGGESAPGTGRERVKNSTPDEDRAAEPADVSKPEER